MVKDNITKEYILNILKNFNDPITHQSLSESQHIGGISIRNNMVQLVIEAPQNITQNQELRHAYDNLKHNLEKTLQTDSHIQSANVIITINQEKSSHQEHPSSQSATMQARHGNNNKINRDYVKHIIAVASGKGGVGKSTTAVNLAIALQKQGKKVGILDADIYGPSLHVMLGLDNQKPTQENNKMIPLIAYGLKAMSIGLLLPTDQPVIWRGPMVMGALQQLLGDVAWASQDDPLDILVVDMPPGTGDAQLTLSQSIDLSGAIIVTTPQDIARIDAKRGYMMFERVHVPILGIIENMSYFLCPHCGEESHIFDHGKAQEDAALLSCPFLGAIPLDIEIRSSGDTGMPIVLKETSTAIQKIYDDIAKNICVQLK